MRFYQCQWPTQAHKQGPLCSNPSRYLKEMIWSYIKYKECFIMIYTHASLNWKIPAMNLVCAKTTFSVIPASLSSSFSPMQAITPKPFSRAWATFCPISYQEKEIQRERSKNAYDILFDKEWWLIMWNCYCFVPKHAIYFWAWQICITLIVLMF